jgi:hypothetical protein
MIVCCCTGCCNRQLRTPAGGCGSRRKSWLKSCGACMARWMMSWKARSDDDMRLGCRGFASDVVVIQMCAHV